MKGLVRDSELECCSLQEGAVADRCHWWTESAPPFPRGGVFTSPKSNSCFQDFETGEEGCQEVLPRKSG